MTLISSDELTFRVEPDPENAGQQCSLLFTGPAGKYLRAGIWRMKSSGPSLIFFSEYLQLNIDGSHRVTHIDYNWSEDIYILDFALSPEPASGVIWINSNPQIDRFSRVYPFNVINGHLQVYEDAQERLDAALATQAAFRNYEIRADAFTGENKLVLSVLIGDCLLDYPQVFEGGHLNPLSQRIGPDDVIFALRSLLPDVPALAEDIIRERPVCLATFVNVQAPDVGSAAIAVRARLDRLFAALADDRGANPQALAFFAADSQGTYSFALPNRSYYGNLLSGIGPGTTKILDRIDAAARTNPWIDFAVGLMGAVRQQTNVEARFFQAWSLIEAAAKRCVERDSTLSIFDKNGKKILLNGKYLSGSSDLGRVYIYFRDYVSKSSLTLKEEINLSNFPDILQVVYQGRNRVAHEGGLSAPGSSPTLSAPNLAQLTHRWAMEVLNYEIRLAAGEKL